MEPDIFVKDVENKYKNFILEAKIGYLILQKAGLNRLGTPINLTPFSRPFKKRIYYKLE